MNRKSKVKGIKVRDNSDDVSNPIVAVIISDEVDEFENSYSAWKQLLHDRRSPFPVETWG